MHLSALGLVLLALLLSSNQIDARRKGEENWKQRYKTWRDSDAQTHHQGALIGTDEAAAAKLYREEQNSVYDSVPEDELWRQKIEEKKQLQDVERQKKYEAKPLSEITAWHEEKWRRKEERRLQAGVSEPQHQKRRQPRHSEAHHHNARVSNDPPPHTKVAEMARYIVHNSDWAAVAYTSRQPETNGLPMADIFSVSDGLKNESTGIPYLYISPKDLGVQDLAKDSRCSLAMSLAQGDYCRREGLDPEDPRCAHIFLTGKIKSLKNGTDEWARAEKYFFDRHPKLRNMPKDHKFRFAKLKINQILVQDYFGGPAQPTLAEYFAAKPEVLNPVQSHPKREMEAEIIPGASAIDSEKSISPVE